MAVDSLGREWQVATIQVDRNLPERFELECINEKGEKERIVMLHAAIMGSIERFMSVLIEHHAGNFPVWMCPVQVLFVPVGENHVAAALEMQKEFAAQGIRTEVDEASETLGNKIRKASGKKIPYIVVVGDKEVAGEPWMIRVRGSQEQLQMTKAEFVNKVMKEIAEKI